MVTKAKSLDFKTTDSVLEAVILESSLIKKYQPPYNVDEKDDKSNQYVVITEEEWPRVFLMRARNYQKGLEEGTIPFKVRNIYGPFLEPGLIKEALKILRKIFPFRDKKAKDPRHEEFYHSIGQSPSKEGDEARESYFKTIHQLTLFFEGKKGQLRRQITVEMNTAAMEMKFEDASRSKRLLYALDHINDIALIKRNKETLTNSGFRLEAYDVAHLSGTNVVGAMVVSIDGELAPSEYRKFKISREINNDSAALAEILFRRLNHSEWAYPDLIVVDGNEIQLKTAQSILKSRRIDIPVVAVTKDNRHKAANLVGNPTLTNKYKREIIAINAEAHRFAIKYYRLRSMLKWT